MQMLLRSALILISILWIRRSPSYSWTSWSVHWSQTKVWQGFTHWTWWAWQRKLHRSTQTPYLVQLVLTEYLACARGGKQGIQKSRLFLAHRQTKTNSYIPKFVWTMWRAAIPFGQCLSNTDCLLQDLARDKIQKALLFKISIDRTTLSLWFGELFRSDEKLSSTHAIGVRNAFSLLCTVLQYSSW